MAQQLLAPSPPAVLAPPVETWRQFMHALEPVEFFRGDTMLQLGVPAEELFVIRSGKAKTSCTFADGRELVLDFHCAGDVLVEPTLFDAAPSTSQTVAITDVQAGRIARADLTKWLALCPEITERLLGCIARRQSDLHQMHLDLMQMDTPARLAKALLRLAERLRKDPRTAALMIEDVTQEELGQYIGSRRDTVNKMLSDFARRGWILIERKSIFLTAPAQLSRRVRVGTFAAPTQ